MYVLESKNNTFLKMDKLVIFIKDKENVTMACPDMKMKKVDFIENSDMDVGFDIATKEEFINAVNKADHNEDWYSLLIKDVALKQIENI